MVFIKFIFWGIMSTFHSSILFVDDEVDGYIIKQMSLSHLGMLNNATHNLEQTRLQLSQKANDACLAECNIETKHTEDLGEDIRSTLLKKNDVVTTLQTDTRSAISILDTGAFKMVTKPLNQKDLAQLLKKALHFSKQHPEFPINSFKTSKKKPSKKHEIEHDITHTLLLGKSEVIENLRTDLKKIARSQAPVFITGESGTGKEIVANLVHQLSRRRKGAFIAINCGAIPHDLLESEFFGYKKGSFTGASQDKQGLIQAANGGSLFLDEIAELPLAMQVKLLRAVQEKKIRPIGGDEEIAVDFRIISASHTDLKTLLEQGKFRQDLFFRLHVMPIHIPPLRQRQQDIILLADSFIKQICAEWKVPQKKLSNAAQNFLLSLNYPGNVRELRNMIERAISLCDSDQIEVEHFKILVEQKHDLSNENQFIEEDKKNRKPIPIYDLFQEEQKNENICLEQYLANIEKDILITALNQTHWNRTLAAQKLGLTFRALRYRLKKYDLD